MPRLLRHPLRLFIEFLAGFAGALAVLWLLLVWRLSVAPMNLAFLTPYTETAITSLIPGTQVTIARSSLAWDNTDRSVTLHVEGVHLTNQANAPIADVPELDMRVSVFGLMLGRLIPAGLRIEHPQVWIERSKDGALLFGGMEAESSGNGDIRGTLGHILRELEHSHLMSKLQMNEAVFAIHDEQTAADWSLAIPTAELARHLGGKLTGEAKIVATQGGRTALVAAHYDYDPVDRRHDVVARFSDINPASLAGPGSKAAILNLPLSGEVSFVFDNAFTLTGGTLDAHGDAGTLNYPDFWDAPAAVKSLDAKAAYDRKTGRLDVSSAVIDFGGPTLAVSFAGVPPADASHDLDFNLSVKLTGLPMDDFARVWPKPVVPGARAWIAASLSKGTFDNGEAAFKGTLKWDDLDDMAITEGQGKISASGAVVKYLDGMPPAAGVGARADFDLNQMTVVVSGGGIGDLKLQPSTIKLTNFEQNVQRIDLPINIAGPLPAVLKLIDAPRFGYAKAIGLSPDAVGGRFDGMVELQFPLLKDLLMKDADIKATGTISDLSSSQLIKGLDIAQGNLALALDKNGFTLKGTAALNKIPLNVSWQEAFSETAGKPLREASIDGDISGPQWARLGVDVLAGTRGPTDVALRMTQASKKSTSFSGTLNLKEAELQIDDLNWKKTAGVPATFAFAAEMPAGKDIAITSIQADGTGLKIRGKGVLAAGSFRPVSISLDPFIVGRNNAALRFTQAPGAGGKLSFTVEGTAFDVTGLRGGKDPARADPRPKEYRLKLGKLYTSDFGFVANASGSAIRDPEGWNEISLRGLADGGHPLDIELTPQPDGHRTFLITCDDFGKTLKGLGFTDTVKSGKLEITGASTPQKPRMIEGKVKIGAFQVKNLPVLVVLMNATSPFGLFNLVTGTLDFDHLAGKFRWQNDGLDLRDVRASGNSVGMTIDGKLDMNTGIANLYGTMAPFSMFNRIIGAIPLIGDMLTGGEGQGVLGVTYTIKGPLDKPNVRVNPASLLTPGFLRNLVFGGGDDDEAPGEAAPSAKTPPPAAQPPPPPAVTNFNK